MAWIRKRIISQFKYLRLINSLSTSSLSSLSLFDSQLEILKQSSKISEISLNWLKLVQKNSVKTLISELTNENELGYRPYSGNVTKGTLVNFVIEQKRLHPDKIILVRVGEFYETYGIDALMLIEYAGLNPMGNKPRAGCPIKNIQQTLDHLTNAGLSVAVYEEINSQESSSVLKKNKIKHRVLSQIISPASSTYTYDLKLSDHLEFKESKPAIGITLEISGYSLSQIYVDERIIIRRDHLPPEALITILRSEGYLEPIYVSKSLKGIISNEFEISEELLSSNSLESFSSINSNNNSNNSTNSNNYNDNHNIGWNFHHQVLRRVGRNLGLNIEEFRDIEHTYHNSINNGSNNGSNSNNIDSQQQQQQMNMLKPKPLSVSTALEIGILSNSKVPSLVKHLLPSKFSTFSVKYLQKQLICPPTHNISNHFRNILQILSTNTSIQLPKMTTISSGKIVSLLSASRCNYDTFREMVENMTGIQNLLISSLKTNTSFANSLLTLASYESGVSIINPDEFLSRLFISIDLINLSISNKKLESYDCEEYSEIKELFRNNEESFHGIFVQGYNNEYDELISEVRSSAKLLIESIKKDLVYLNQISPSKRGVNPTVEISYDSINNIIAFRKTNTSKLILNSELKNEGFLNPLDRNHQPINNKLISIKTSTILSTYLQNCSKAQNMANEMMKDLCQKLYQNILTLVQSSHCATIFQCAYEHTESSIQKDWILPTLTKHIQINNNNQNNNHNNSNNNNRVFYVQGLFPYWMKSSMAVTNDVEINGTVLLTAPNMAGKSTLMRSVLVTALLANCGLFVPCLKSANIPEYDAYFLRTSSFDIPSEGKSSLAVEMNDLRVIMRDSSPYSLVMMDEIGRGTSTRDGAAISGAILEWMSKINCHGIFSTHILELIDMNLNANLIKKRMGVKSSTDTLIKWSYKLEDGWIADSMALETAKQFGVSSQLIQRAIELKGQFKSTHSNELFEQNNSYLSNKTSSNNLNKYSINSIKTIMSQIIQNSSFKNHILSSNILIIPFGFLPSPILESHCCVYVLVFKEIEEKSDNKLEAIYVGETESISARLENHRKNKKFLEYLQHSSLTFDTLVIQVDNKSSARAIETELITYFKVHNYELCGDSDQWHSLFSN